MNNQLPYKSLDIIDTEEPTDKVGLSADLDGHQYSLNAAQRRLQFDFENWLLNNCVGVPERNGNVPTPPGYNPRKTLAYEYRSPTMVRWFFVDFDKLPPVGEKFLLSLQKR